MKSNPKDALHIYAENEAARKRDEAVLIDSRSELYTIETDEKITDNFKHLLEQLKLPRTLKTNKY